MAKVKGAVTLTVRENGRVVSVQEIDNLQTNHSMATIAAWLTGTPNTGAGYLPPSQIGMGTGTSSGGVRVTDTALWTAASGTLLACDQISVYNTYYAMYQKTYQVGQLNGTYAEIGLFDANGLMWGHVQANLTITSTQTLTVQWKVYLEVAGSNGATITNYALQSIAQWLAGTLNCSQTTVLPPSRMVLGRGTGVVTAQDKSLFIPVYSTLGNCDYAISSGGTATFSRTWLSGVSGSYTEVGLEDVSGNLWAHALAAANNPNNLIVSEQIPISLTAS